MVPASVMMLALLIFTGFVVPVDYMLPWCRWINYVNPVAYGYEALMVNEFHNRQFVCSSYIPDYANATTNSGACDVVGAIPGNPFVNGEDHINLAFSYRNSHKWRNVGIIIAMVAFNYLIYFITSEYVTAKKSKGEILVFRRGYVPKQFAKGGDDLEKMPAGPITTLLERPRSSEIQEKGNFQGSTSVFHWNNVCYDIKIKKKTRRILKNVDGWIKPGTLTALMGVSGAGKTTLLDCLANRTTGVGIITGEMLVDGKICDQSFQRKTGYVQQQDLHLETTTVREVCNLILCVVFPHFETMQADITRRL
jgi:ABC-type multidrug transport system fused ATPase/permease subunit